MHPKRALILIGLGVAWAGFAPAQMTGKTISLSQPWKQTPVEQESGPDLENGWCETHLKAEGWLEVPSEEKIFARIITALRGIYLPESQEVNGMLVRKDGTMGQDASDPRVRIENFTFTHHFLEDDKVNQANIKGRVTLRTDSQTIWDYERLSNNIDYSVADPKQRLKKIAGQKPEAREIYSKGDARYLHRLLVRMTVRLVPDPATGRSRIEATYRREYVIYTANLWQIVSKANSLITDRVKGNTTSDTTEHFTRLLYEIEKGLARPD